jgi:hypothetical protein
MNKLLEITQGKLVFSLSLGLVPVAIAAQLLLLEASFAVPWLRVAWHEGFGSLPLAPRNYCQQLTSAGTNFCVSAFRNTFS